MGNPSKPAPSRSQSDLRSPSRVRTIGAGHAQLSQAKAMCPFRTPDIRRRARGHAGMRGDVRLLASGRQGDDRGHLDVGGGITQSVQLFRVQKHDRATGAGIERCGVERAVLAFHRDYMPAIKGADAAPPLPGRSSHRDVSLANLSPPRESSALAAEPLDKCFRSARRLRSDASSATNF